MQLKYDKIGGCVYYKGSQCAGKKHVSTTPPHTRSATSVGYVLYSPDIFYDLKDFFYLLVMEL